MTVLLLLTLENFFCQWTRGRPALWLVLSSLNVRRALRPFALNMTETAIGSGTAFVLTLESVSTDYAGYLVLHIGAGKFLPLWLVLSSLKDCRTLRPLALNMTGTCIGSRAPRLSSYGGRRSVSRILRSANATGKSCACSWGCPLSMSGARPATIGIEHDQNMHRLKTLMSVLT
jgi:hypothetical protein